MSPPYISIPDPERFRLTQLGLRTWCECQVERQAHLVRYGYSNNTRDGIRILGLPVITLSAPLHVHAPVPILTLVVVFVFVFALVPTPLLLVFPLHLLSICWML